MTLGDLQDVEIGEFLFLLFGVLFGLLILVWLFYLFAVRKRAADDAACPTREEYARVIDCGRLPANAIPQWSSVDVLFELKSGERISFVVAATEHYVVGDQGMLKWQGKSIRSFIRDAGDIHK